jgi:hypothetical protein
MTPANLDMQATFLNPIDSPAPSPFLWGPQLPTRLCPSRMRTWRARAAINTADVNGQANTITLETGTRPLTAVDNGADGPHGRRDPRGDPEPR